MKPKAIAYRDETGFVVMVISVDRKHVWKNTEQARKFGYDVFYIDS